MLIIIAAVLLCSSYYLVVTSSTKLAQDKLKLASSPKLEVLDYAGYSTSINELKGKADLVTYNQLSKHTIDAFVCAEDKRFFKHKGIDYIRVAGAIKNNIFNPKHKQGGSTITQQVVKNTQLTSERTIDRKLKEFKLAKRMEKLYSKQQILEIYLNSIYFGNGCYGINNASEYYFNKPAAELSVAESALLAATINAPSIYDPVANPDKAKMRKDLILEQMYKQNKIDKNTLENCKNELIEIEKAHKNYKNQYYNGLIAEACNLLKITENQLANGQYKIYSYYNPQVQEMLQKQIQGGKYTTSNSSKLGAIVLDNSSCSVVALAANSSQNLLSTYRQPGSAIKPIMVYAPAFESGKYSPASFIEDSRVSINGYSPENASKTYSGMVSIRESIKRSLNVPAVKVLDSLGINYCKNFAKGMGIGFEPSDTNLALALGGFTKGTTIKQLSDAYMCFANSGNYCQSSFISKIEDSSGKTIYNRNISYSKACSPATSYLISSCLNDVAKTGTAKRLADLNLPLYSKTGTVGGQNGNTDAYNVCYTSDHTICCWIGSNNSTECLPASVNGATYPTLFVKGICCSLYSSTAPKEIAMPEGVARISLNGSALAEYKLEADADGDISDLFNKKYLPPQTARSVLDTTLSANNFSGSAPELKFKAARTNKYKLYRSDGKSLVVVKEFSFCEGDISYADTSAKQNVVYDYWVEASCGGKTKTSNHIKLIAS